MPIKTAVAAGAEDFRPDRYKTGMVCFLSSEAAFFGTLLAAYAVSAHRVEWFSR